MGAITQSSQYGAAGRTRDEVVLVLDAQELVHQLQRERGLTAGLLGGDQSFRSRVDSQRKASDQARAALDRQLAGNSPGVGAVREALAQLGSLATVRGEADGGSVGRAEALAFYTRAITALTDAAFHGGTELEDRQLTDGLTTLRKLGDGTEAAALERGTLNGILATGSFSDRDYRTFITLLGTKGDALAEVPRTATAAQTHALDAVMRNHSAVAVARMEQQVLTAHDAKKLPVAPADWWQPATALVDGLHQVQIRVADDTSARADQLRSDALRQLLMKAVLALLAIAGAAVLALAATRSILRPLHALTEEAHRIADLALPQAVARVREAQRQAEPAELTEGFTGSALAARGDEIANVAGALDRVADTALRLAVDQAVLQRTSTESLANLGRRNKELVSRQLGFLSALERSEDDPGTLANLFELDHLATRMRRNAESLLVLAGERSPRRWADPVPMGDVLRSALGEVDDYRRVLLRHTTPALLDGGAVSEVAHLLAELIENALAASSPETDVEIYAQEHGADYMIAVVDHGGGLSEAELATANRRLSGQESFLVGRTQLLGHYVVGRLAVGLGARVWLAPSPMAGVTASVLLPGRLLSGQADLAAVR
ncbi:sensor histidine kinase [Streptomyces indiaensis]|uniref:sensor histidine kinase n=1 Tax=Streptomyces indiaensis TaxID=284033 RepID=UPI001F16B8B8|nr:ATP-binding protein [Streptomyces indiaensis]MCF1644591.1 nitrate- and nitrite sensing domain-containing protein [Streptomyces indiaensis]